MFILISRKTEIARSARGLKLQWHRAEDVLAESYIVQKFFVDLITADHKVLSEGCESRNNHRFAVVVQVRAKQKLFRKLKGACKSSWSRQGGLKSFTLTIPWSLAKPVKTFLGIIVRRHPTIQKQMGLLKRAVRRNNEWTSAVLLQAGLDEKWWADSMECHCYLRNVLDLSDGKTLY